MSEQNTFRNSFNSLILQKKANLLLDNNEKYDPPKNIEKKHSLSANHKNGANSDKHLVQTHPQRDHEQNGIVRIEEDLVHLKRQIDSLESYDQLDLKLRYESEAFILRKRRKYYLPYYSNLFRAFEKK